VDQNEATVDEAMSPAPFVVETDTALEDVATTMVRRKLGSAIVTRDGKVVGVFTTIDALRALIPPKKRSRARSS
jgi:acetoin utilization protein AcuB